MAVEETKVLTRYIADTSQEQQAIDGLIRKVNQLKQAETVAAREREQHFDQLVLDISRAARAEEDLEGAMQRQRNASRETMNEMMGLFGKVAGGIGMVVGAAAAIEAVIDEHHKLRDEYIELSNIALKFAGESQTATEVIEEQAKVAHELGVPLRQTMGLYDGVRDGVEGLNLSHREQIRLTEELGKAAIMEGQSVEQAGESLKRLSVIMSLGKDAARPLQQFMIDMPGLAEQWTSKFGGSNAAFIKAVTDGKVSFQDLVLSIINGNGKIDESFAKRTKTNEQWHTEITEAYRRAAGQGKNFSDIMMAGFQQANTSLDSNRITVKQWGEDMVAMLARVQDKAYASIRESFASSINVATASLVRFGNTAATVFEKFGTKGIAGFREMIDPWYSAKDMTKDELQGFIEMDDDNMSDDVLSRRQKRAERAKKLVEKRKKESSARAKDWTDALMEQLERDAAYDRDRDFRDRGFTGGVDFDAASGYASQAGSGLKGMQDALRQIQEEAITKAEGRNQSLMESMFGPIEQFDAYAQAASHLGSVFDAFGEAVGSSYEAIVTGQGSVSEAFTTMFADMLMAMGKSSAIEALRELALGFGSLALGPLGGVSASMHFKAAAMHGTVAALAGAAAHSIGTSAQVSADQKAAEEKRKQEEKAEKERDKQSGRGGAGRSGGGDGDGNHYTIVVGEHFYSESNRMRQLDAQKFVRTAVGNSYVDHN